MRSASAAHGKPGYGGAGRRGGRGSNGSVLTISIPPQNMQNPIMGQNPRSIVSAVQGGSAAAYKTRNSVQFRDAVKLHDVDEHGKAKPTIHIKRNRAGEQTAQAHTTLPPAPCFSLPPPSPPHLLSLDVGLMCHCCAQTGSYTVSDPLALADSEPTCFTPASPP